MDWWKRIVRIVVFAVAVAPVLASPVWAGAFEDVHAGKVASQRGHYGEAIRLFTQDIDSGELSNAILAVTYFSRVISGSPRSWDGYIGRCLTYERMGRTEAAISDCRTALGLYPNLLEAENALQRMGAPEIRQN